MQDIEFSLKSITALNNKVFKLVLYSCNLPKIKCGQFANIKVPNRPDLILRRPFCVNDVDYKSGTITIIFEVRGEGTQALSKLKEGQTLQILLPLGNGFTVQPEQKKVMLVGGGLGVCPVYSVFGNYPDKQFYAVLGFKNASSVILANDFASQSVKTMLYTDDGSIGRQGYVTQNIAAHIEEFQPDVILACGPESMLRYLKQLNLSVPVQVSLEERMGCGVGGCLVCVCKVERQGQQNLRVCKDGPVFDLKEVLND